jgi:hypothetical protein
MTMKKLGKMMLMALLPATAGCATVEKPLRLETVGPAPTTTMAVSSQEGTLQVFSAREKRDLDIAAEIFFEGEGDDVLCEPAHTDYTIRESGGAVIRRVRNARDADDAQPTLVRLPPGYYEIEAEAKDCGLVTVPVVIKAGKPTVVNLQGDWRRIVKSAKRDDFVWLYGTEIVGWRANAPAYAKTR